jgi:RNA-binding protein YlmH
MGISRSKLKEMVESGEVMVNWKEQSSPAHSIREGDLITIRGRGRVQIVGVEETAKGRFRVSMVKFT